MTVEEVDDAYAVETPRGRHTSIEEMRSKLQLGIVEEPLESPQFAQESRLSVNRGVSIVSVHSDEERSPSPIEKGVQQELTPIQEKKVQVSEPSTPDITETKPEPKQAKRLDRTTSRLVSVEEEPKTPEVKGAAEPKKGLKLERRTSELKSWDGEESGSPLVEETVQLTPKKGRLVQTASQEEQKVQSRRESASSVKSVEEPVPQRGRRSRDEDAEDPEVEELLKRVQRQRSQLEEILDKEDGRKSEGTNHIIYTHTHGTIII